MSLRVEDAEFWLPPEFLTDDDIVKGKNGSRFGFVTDAEPKDLFPYDFESLGFSSDLGSPVESLVGSTETESDEEDFIAGLTSKFVKSTIEDEIPRSNPSFPSDNIKAWGLSRSPQSTLCLPRIGCVSRVPSPGDAWDMHSASANDVARTRTVGTSISFHGGRGLPGPPVLAEPVNLGSGFHKTNPSLSYQKLRAAQIQRLNQLQMLKQRQAQLAQNRGRPIGSNNNDRPSGLIPSAWPSLQQARHQRQTGSGMRAVFLGDPTVKRECAGTGVFLPRLVNTNPSIKTETRKKPALSTVLLPDRVVQALNLKLDEPDVHPYFHPGSDLINVPSADQSSFRIQYGNGIPIPKPSVRTEQDEPMLPQEWSY